MAKNRYKLIIFDKLKYQDDFFWRGVWWKKKSSFEGTTPFSGVTRLFHMNVVVGIYNTNYDEENAK